MKRLMVIRRRNLLAPHGYRDARVCRRVPVRQMRIGAVVEISGERDHVVPGRLIDVSGGGSSLLVPAWTVEGIEQGNRCVLSVALAEGKLHLPATVVAIEPDIRDEQAILRISFRATDSATRQRLTHWVNDLAVALWRA